MYEHDHVLCNLRGKQRLETPLGSDAVARHALRSVRELGTRTDQLHRGFHSPAVERA